MSRPTARATERANEQEIDLLKYQINEIDEADFKEGEEAELAARYKVSSNSTHLLELSQKVLYELGDAEDSVLSRLGDIARSVRELERTDPSLADSTGGFDTAQLELQELDSNLRDYVEGLEFDPSEIAALEERINLLESLKRKYGAHVEEILQFRDEAAAKLAKIEGRSEELDRLQGEIKSTRRATDAAAVKLSQKRRKAAPKLAKEIGAHLTELGFKRAKIEILLEPLGEPGPGGIEHADFSFAPNPGEPSKPLRLIASSGEMSRVMLAVKSALAKQDSIPLLVFDEIDANVGGEIAQAVGAKMASLGESHQVISITHLPQVAALASCHYFVSKEFGKERTRTVMRRVENDERVAEIARMLGGKAESARAHAESLLGI
jgi:DNA repair protein RecN (Recombination protein N)